VKCGKHRDDLLPVFGRPCALIGLPATDEKDTHLCYCLLNLTTAVSLHSARDGTGESTARVEPKMNEGTRIDMRSRLAVANLPGFDGLSSKDQLVRVVLSEK
jgi:hypothetical protein